MAVFGYALRDYSYVISSTVGFSKYHIHQKLDLLLQTSRKTVQGKMQKKRSINPQTIPWELETFLKEKKKMYTEDQQHSEARKKKKIEYIPVILKPSLLAINLLQRAWKTIQQP